MLISAADEANFSLFAPNQTAMDEAEEMIKSFLEQQVFKDRERFDSDLK